MHRNLRYFICNIATVNLDNAITMWKHLFLSYESETAEIAPGLFKKLEPKSCSINCGHAMINLSSAEGIAGY